MLAGRPREALQLGRNALILYFMIEYAQEGIGLAERGLKAKAFTIDVELFWFYLIVPAGFCLLAAVGVEHILRAIKGLIDAAALGLGAQSLSPVSPRAGRDACARRVTRIWSSSGTGPRAYGSTTIHRRRECFGPNA